MIPFLYWAVSTNALMNTAPVSIIPLRVWKAHAYACVSDFTVPFHLLHTATADARPVPELLNNFASQAEAKRLNEFAV